MPAETRKRRIEYLDAAKGIGIFLVVFGHYPYIPEPLNIWLSSFHLPLFFVTSGILMYLNQETKRDRKEMFRKKTRGILVPYAWFSLLTIIWYAIRVLAGEIQRGDLLIVIIRSAMLRGYEVLWFLPVLFFGQLAAWFLLRKCFPENESGLKKAVIMTAVLTLISLAYYHLYARALQIIPITGLRIQMIYYVVETIGKTLIAAVYLCTSWLLARIVQERYSFFTEDGAQTPKKKKDGKQKTGRCGLHIGLLFLGIMTILSAALERIRDLNGLNVGSLLVYYALGITGSLGLLLICRELPKSKLLNYWGKNSLIIMSTHINLPVLYFSLKLTEQTRNMLGLTGAYGLFEAVLTLGIVFLIEVPLIYLIQRYLPFVLGKKTVR